MSLSMQWCKEVVRATAKPCDSQYLLYVALYTTAARCRHMCAFRLLISIQSHLLFNTLWAAIVSAIHGAAPEFFFKDTTITVSHASRKISTDTVFYDTYTLQTAVDIGDNNAFGGCESAQKRIHSVAALVCFRFCQSGPAPLTCTRRDELADNVASAGKAASL
jgi:hypothetical protein